MRYPSMLAVVVIGLSVIAAPPASSAQVSFADSSLESAIRLAICKPSGPLLASDLQAMTALSAGYYQIANLSGIEHCTNLQTLDLRHNAISSIAQLSTLTKLKTLELQYNSISDLGPLTTLRGLETLHLQGNKISSIAPLQGIATLTELWLGGNTIANLSPLANHGSLRALWVNDNEVTSIQPLASCTGLREVWLGNNAISSIAALSSLTNLRYVWIESNQIVDISPLRDLPQLDQVWANGNRIYDIRPLADNTALGANNEVDVRDNCLYIAPASSAAAAVSALESRGVWVFASGQAPPAPRNIQGSPNPAASRGTVRCSFNIDASLQPLTYTWTATDASGSPAGLFDTTTAASPNWTAPANSSGEDIEYEIGVAVGWAGGGSARTSATYTQTVGTVTQQVSIIHGPESTPNPVASGRDVIFSVAAEHSLDGSIGYEWSAASGEFSDPAAPEPTWTAPANPTDDIEEYEITCTAYCIEHPGVMDERSYVQAVNPVVHTLEIASGPRSDLNPCAGGGQIRLFARGRDTRAHQLAYEWSAEAIGGGPEGVFDDASSAEPTWTAPVNSAGLTREYRLTLTLSCSGGGSKTASFVQQVVPGAQHVFRAGRAMIGVPLLLAGNPLMEALLGANSVIAWDPILGRYVTVTEPTPYQLGRGYWAQFASDTQRLIEGYQVTGEREVAVSTGWNMLCSPYTYPVGLEPMLNAAAIQPFAWTDQGEGYELVANIADALNRTHATFEPFWGYWVLAHRDTSLRWSPTHAAHYAAPPVQSLQIGSADAELGGWQIQLVAEAGGRVDACNYLGVASEALATRLSIPNPPEAAGSVDIYFPTPDGRMAASILPMQPGELRWDFVVTDTTGETVRLLFPDISCVPMAYRLTLTDRTCGTSQNLRTTSAYTFPGPGTRSMQITASPKGASTPAITTLQAQQIGAQAVTLTYALSADADVLVEIRNIAGRTIRQIRCGLQQAGINTTSWDLRGATGAQVPSGRYLCTLTARSDDGTQMSALTAVNVVR